MTPRLVATAILCAMLVTVPAFTSAGIESGHWDNLGEDGLVWVPDEPPTASYLPPADLGAYHNASEAVATLAALAAARPDLLSVQTIGASVQGRPLVLATLTAPGDANGRVRVLFDGAHHGDEVIGAEILVRFVERVIAEYDTNATMRAALAQVVVEIVPMVNPDGVDLSSQCANYATCRKNAHGVDLNRNYPAHWGEPGASGNPSDATYRGPAPASEPETQVIKSLLDATDHAVYASLHSGAEMILWPWGWTTTPPPEAAMYETLGGELTAITGAPNGQVSRILYGVSGDSMDQAYGAADGWRAVAISPETYEGSGSAFDWWLLFNPPEQNASIAPVVARWDKFLWHLVKEAPGYAPARIEAPPALSLGPDAGDLSFVVTGAAKRPFQGAAMRFVASDAVDVLSPNPVALAPTSGAQNGMFTLLPTRGGDLVGTLRLEAGPAGSLTREVELELVQVGVDMTLADDVLESPDAGLATLTIDSGPFTRVVGSARFESLPDGLHLGDVAFDATAGTPSELAFSFPVAQIRGGVNTLRATATFNATDELGAIRPGSIRIELPFTVLRPQVGIEKRFAPSTIAGNAVSILVFYRNTGTFAAEDLVVRETVPAGYTYWTRDGPVPVPPDPLGRPQPTSIEPRPDGGVDLVYDFGTVAPGAFKVAQYRLMALVPGQHTLPSGWTYAGDFDAARVEYAHTAAPGHLVKSP